MKAEPGSRNPGKVQMCGTGSPARPPAFGASVLGPACARFVDFIEFHGTQAVQLQYTDDMDEKGGRCIEPAWYSGPVLQQMGQILIPFSEKRRTAMPQMNTRIVRNTFNHSGSLLSWLTALIRPTEATGKTNDYNTRSGSQ